jgi:hypothetical protein
VDPLKAVHRNAASRRNLIPALKLVKPVQGRFDDIMGVVRPHAFGQNILNADGFEHGAHGTPRDQSRSFRSRFQQHLTGTVATDHLEGNRAFDQGHLHHAFLGFLDPLANGLRYLAGLSQTEADIAVTVTDDNNGAEAESATALDDLCDPIDVNDLLN